ncbi:MAG: hypothetical protein Q9178_006007 [Gyalolechia marmorata]
MLLRARGIHQLARGCKSSLGKRGRKPNDSTTHRPSPSTYQLKEVHLVALDVTLENTQFIAMNELQRVLATCKNLQKLAVRCLSDVPSDGFEYLVDPDVRLPRLRYMTVWGLLLVNYNLPGWSDCVDWDALEYLETTDIGFSQHVERPEMTHLRSLTLSLDMLVASALDERREQRLMSFIYRLPKLEHLSGVCSTRMVLASDLLKYRGESLKTLKLHEDSNYRIIMPRCFPSEEDIRLLGSNCTRLETYAIDIGAGADWPWMLFSSIAESLWFIVHLELNVELLATKRGIQPVQVILTSVQEIWNFLWTNIARVRKNNSHIISQPRLRTLKISTRDPSGDTMHFAARLSERDDLAAKGHADVVCLELEGLEEKYGHGPLEDQHRENFRQNLAARVEKGVTIRENQTTWDYMLRIQARPLRTTLSEMAEW